MAPPCGATAQVGTVSGVGANGVKEYYPRESLFREVQTQIHADHIVTTSSRLRSLLYKIY